MIFSNINGSWLCERMVMSAHLMDNKKVWNTSTTTKMEIPCE